MRNGSSARILAAVVVGALTTCALQMLPAQGDEPDPPSAAGVIEAAAQGYSLGDARSAADLANAAASHTPIELVGGPGEALAVTETTTGTVDVDSDGAATLNIDGLPAIGIKFDGDPRSVDVVDGVVVQTEVAPSTDVVTRATETGVQMIAILADASAPSEVLFPLDLPRGAELAAREDGSITILADVVAELPAVEGGRVVRSEIRQAEVATIAAPWAVDANGKPVTTRFKATDRGILQIIDIEADTLFPVVADPQMDPGGTTGCTLYSGKGTMGCFWQYSGSRGTNFSIPWTTPADLGVSSATTPCIYGNLNTAPSGWGNRISSMANWTNYTHTYYTGTNKGGSSRAVARGTAVGTLTASLDNNFESLYMTCAPK